MAMRYDVAKIIRARTVKGWTQTELARRIDKDPSTVSKIENEEMTALPPTMKRIAEELGLSMEDLIIDEPSEATA